MFTKVALSLFRCEGHNGNDLLPGVCVTSYHIPVLINKTSNAQAEYLK